MEITETRPTLACSRLNDPDDPSPRPAIEAFDKGISPWIVSVRMISEGVDIRRLRVLVYATNMATKLGFRQITGRVVRADPKNRDEDYGIVVLPADPRLVDMAERILEEMPPVQRGALVIREPRSGSTTIRGPRDDAGFVALGSTGELAMITDTNGRSAPASPSLAESLAAGSPSVQVISSGSVIAKFHVLSALIRWPWPLPWRSPVWKRPW